MARTIKSTVAALVFLLFFLSVRVFGLDTIMGIWDAISQYILIIILLVILLVLSRRSLKDQLKPRKIFTALGISIVGGACAALPSANSFRAFLFGFFFLIASLIMFSWMDSGGKNLYVNEEKIILQKKRCPL